jgi:hypothetical protein
VDGGWGVTKADLGGGKDGILESGEGDLTANQIVDLAADTCKTNRRNLLVEICAKKKHYHFCLCILLASLTILVGRHGNEGLADFDVADLMQVGNEVSDVTRCLKSEVSVER